MVNLMEMCTPMDGQNSLLLFASTKEDSVSGYVATRTACMLCSPILVTIACVFVVVRSYVCNAVLLLLHLKTE